MPISRRRPFGKEKSEQNSQEVVQVQSSSRRKREAGEDEGFGRDCDPGELAAMASSKNMHVYEARKGLPNLWHSELIRTPVDDPVYCCYSMLCPCAASYGLRGRVLYNDWSRYQCCGGGMPCSGSCGEESCPQLCAILEVTLCFTLSVSATRFMLQDALQIQNTKCDNCIIASMFFAQYLNCICWLVAMFTNVPFLDDAAIVTDRVADISYCAVCACLQTQHKLELDKRDGKLFPRETAPPPPQEMSRY